MRVIDLNVTKATSGIAGGCRYERSKSTLGVQYAACDIGDDLHVAHFDPFLGVTAGGRGCSDWSAAAVDEYSAVVIASNTLGQVSSRTRVTVLEAVAGLLAASGSPTLYGETSHLTATLAAGTNASYIWDLGDGSTVGGPQVSHAYALPGQYTAIVTASNTLSQVSAAVPVLVAEAVTGLNRQ